MAGGRQKGGRLQISLSSHSAALRRERSQPVGKDPHPPALCPFIMVGKGLRWRHSLVTGAGRREGRQLRLSLLNYKFVWPFSSFSGNDNPIFGCGVLPYLRHILTTFIVSLSESVLHTSVTPIPALDHRCGLAILSPHLIIYQSYNRVYPEC